MFPKRGRFDGAKKLASAEHFVVASTVPTYMLHMLKS
jgi:hypothetical protein